MGTTRFEKPEPEKWLDQFKPDPKPEELELVPSPPGVAMERLTVGMNTSRANALRVESLAREVLIDMGRVDQDLKDSVRTERQGAIRAAAAKKGDEIVTGMHRELETMRNAARHFDADVLRRRARFDPDATKDATIRLAWQGRASAAAPEALADFAADAVATGSPALAQLLLEAVMARKDVSTEVLQLVKRRVGSIPVPGAEDARRQLATAEQALEDATEQLRRLRGGRPSGAHLIRRGLRARGVQA